MKIIVKNRKLLVFIVLLISSAVSKGQIYKYIGLEDGLNNQKIYHIQKDRRGYMWFLTQEGVDRYDGKHIKHYTFSDDSMTVSYTHLRCIIHTKEVSVIFVMMKSPH